MHSEVLPWIAAFGSLEGCEKHAVTSLKVCSLHTEGLIGFAEDLLHFLQCVFVLQEGFSLIHASQTPCEYETVWGERETQNGSPNDQTEDTTRY